MTKEQKKLFIKLVNESAPWKAFERKLGLTREAFRAHLGRLAQYEKDVAEVPMLPGMTATKKARGEIKSVVVERKKNKKDSKNA